MRIVFLLVSSFVFFQAIQAFDRQLNILFVLNKFPSATQSFFINQIKGFMDHGHNVTVLARVKTKAGLPSALQNSSATLKVCYKKLESQNRHFDVIYCPLHFTVPWTCKFIEKYNLTGKLIIGFHGAESSFKNKSNSHIYDTYFAGADRYVVTAEFTKQKLIEFGCLAEKISVISVGIDPDKFSIASWSEKPVKNFNIVSVARLVPIKGLIYGICAIDQLRKMIPNIRYKIIGDGLLKESLGHLVDALNLHEYVEFEGFVPHGEISPYLKQAHVLLFTSVTLPGVFPESMPTVIKEAMASGLQVVSFDHGGISEMIQHDISGFLVPEKKISELVDKVMYLYNHPQKCESMGFAGRQIVEKNFLLDQEINALISLFYEMKEQAERELRSREPIIKNLKICKQRVEVQVNEVFKQEYLTDDFFAEYSADIDLRVLDQSLVVMPFIMNVITIIWISGKHYSIGSMDECLYRSLQKIKKIYQKLYPKTKWDGTLTPAKLVKNKIPQPQPDDAIALYFSHGLDSVCSSWCNMDKKQLLITVKGHNDTPFGQAERWRVVINRIRDFATTFGHKSTVISSNYRDFFNRPYLDRLSPEIDSWRPGTCEGFAWVGLAGPLLYSLGYQTLRIASSLSWGYPWAQTSSPLIDDKIMWAGINVFHDCFDYARVQKCKLLAKMAQQNNFEYPFCKTCNPDQRGLNCCKCRKCKLTMWGFIAVGQRPQDYGFDRTVDQVIQMAREFFHPGQTFGRVLAWEFLQIQRMIKETYTTNDLLPDSFKDWFLSLDIQSMNRDLVKQFPTMNWKDYQHLVSGIPGYLLKE